MKCAIVTCINGSFAVSAEYSSLQSAKVGFHQQCAALWNAEDVTSATVSIVDETLGTVQTETITHETTTEEETTEES